MTPWFVAGAAVSGTTHRRTNTPCQDYFGYRVGDDSLVMILADGAGSAPRSREGAQSAVDAALTNLTNALDREVPAGRSGWTSLMEQVVAAARSALVEAAGGESLGDYATTLTCAAVSSNHVMIAQIGDAMVVAQSQSGEISAYMSPQRAGEYANQTRFITDDDALDRVVTRYEPIRLHAVMATTDGLLPVATDSHGQPFHPFWRPLVRHVDQAARDGLPPDTVVDQMMSFLESERICARVDDDKTLLVAVRADIPDRETRCGSSAGRSDSE